MKVRLRRRQAVLSTLRDRPAQVKCGESLESCNEEKETNSTNSSVYAESGRFLEHVKRKDGRILHACTVAPTQVDTLRRRRGGGRNQSREIGNLAAYVRNKRCPWSCRKVGLWVAITSGEGLFNTNAGDC